MRVPLWYLKYDLGNTTAVGQILQIQTQYELSTRRKAVALVNSHARTGKGLDGRARLHGFNCLEIQGVQVDAPGKLKKNMPSLQAQGLSKIQFLQKYLFNLCPENSLQEGYVTEKIFDAVIAGCIPVYWGNIPVEEAVLNQERILFYKPTTCNSSSLKEVKVLINNLPKLEEIWHLPVFTSRAQEELHKIYNGIGVVVELYLEKSGSE